MYANTGIATDSTRVGRFGAVGALDREAPIQGPIAVFDLAHPNRASRSNERTRRAPRQSSVTLTLTVD
jgi:hypothetical protein